MSIPLIGQAKNWKHDNFDKHHNHSSFWENVERRQYRQHERIDQGIQSGQLTRREVKKLKRKKRYVAKQIRNIKRHRYLSYEDKSCVNEYLDNYSAKIRHYKHNDHYARRNKYNRHKDNYQSHNHQYDRNYKKDRYYRKDRQFSWAKNDYSAGIYFKY